MNNSYDKLTRFCLYRERCTQEVMQKMNELKVSDSNKPKLIEDLRNEGYLNDERFLQAFIHSKIYIKRWGKKKIESELLMKRFDRKLIQQKFQDVDDELYISNLHQTAEKKWATLYKKAMPEKKQSLIRYMLGKGYEMDLIQDWLKNIKI